MTRSIFLILGFILILSGVILAVNAYQLKEQEKTITVLTKQVDSLTTELESVSISNDYANWIVEQIKLKNPKEVKTILDESE
jgi:uncharacterized protein YoxC